MDRLMVYPGAIPLDTDVLSVERNVMKALGWLTQATMGTGTGVIGLPCNPTVPASMTVNVGPGAIWAQAQIDQASFGSLPADASPLMKMGILSEAAGTNFTLTPPATSGQSINYLIEAAFEETDAAPVVLPYVNPANPAQPFTGPDNAGTPQNTVRAQLVDLQMKAGVAANTGTQVTPNVDAGYVGLYVITINFGQTSIIAADISQFSGAPFNRPPFACLTGNANQPFAVGLPTQPNEAVALSQFNGSSTSQPLNPGCSISIGVPNANGAPVYIQSLFLGNTIAYGQWVPFANPFPNNCYAIAASDGGGGDHTVVACNYNRFGTYIYAVYGGNTQQVTAAQFMAIGD